MTSKITRALVATAAATSLGLAPAMTLAPTTAHAATTVVAKAGQHNATVKSIQNNLAYLHYLSSKDVIGTYGPKTTAAVKAFQKAYKLPVTGVVDSNTYKVLTTKAAARRAADQKAAAAKKAADARVIAKPGDHNKTVGTIQYRLYVRGYLAKSDIVENYGPKTTAAVKAFQKANGLAVTGVVNGATYGKLSGPVSSTHNVTRTTSKSTSAVRLDSRCLTGRVVCVDKTRLRMYWVINGKVQDDWSVRVGRPSLPTREGTFHIYLKSTNWWSTLYNVRMPYTQFFSGGEAIHYSVDFATNGYYGGGSHGCVNMRDLAGAKWLYSQTRVGDKVVVYRS